MDSCAYGLSNTDIQFIKQKSDEGNLVFVQGQITATGEVVTYTPATGKTFYLLKARVLFVQANLNNSQTVELRNDGVAKETLRADNDDANSAVYPMEFILTGDKLVGNGSKKYSIECTINPVPTPVRGHILGYLEDT